MARVNLITLVVGDRGTGKTTYVKGSRDLKINGLLDTYQKAGSRALVVDTFDNPIWRDVPVITPEQIQTFAGLARIFSSDTSSLMKLIEQRLYNSVLIFEDATKFLRRWLDDSTRKFVLDSKQKNLDIYFLFHYLGAVPPDLARISDYIVLFKTNEGFNSYLKNKFPNPAIEAGAKEVNANESRYFNKVIQISG
ncbi:MAG: hypothetical protein PHS33_08505 [Candidatus Omnitrophica bacterium]|nr:hypothetical protein [Candidatus Omnitrophota bacterium]